MKNISQEEKIDYIYTTLKKEQKAKKIKFFVKTLFYIVLLFAFYLYIPYLINSKINEIKTSLTPNINQESISNWLEKLKESFFWK